MNCYRSAEKEILLTIYMEENAIANQDTMKVNWTASQGVSEEEETSSRSCYQAELFCQEMNQVS